MVVTYHSSHSHFCQLARRALSLELAAGPLASCAVLFQPAVGATGAHRAVAFHLAVRAGVARRAVLLQLAMGAPVAFYAVLLHLAVRTRVARRALAFLHLLPAPPRTRVVGLGFLFAFRRGPLGFHKRLEPAFLVHEELVVFRVQGNGLLRQAVGHRSVSVVPPLETRFTNIVVRALSASVPESNKGRGAAPVTRDSLVLPEMRGALFLIGG